LGSGSPCLLLVLGALEVWEVQVVPAVVLVEEVLAEDQEELVAVVALEVEQVVQWLW